MTNLSKDLKARFGKGFSKSNIYLMRQFYLKYQIFQSVTGKLTWTHYSELLAVSDENARGFYEIQAMACGTPVIGFRRGSVPEVIEDGVSGYIVKNTDEMITAVTKIPQLNRNTVRSYCTKRFASDILAKQYLSLFEEILAKHCLNHD